MPWLKRNYGKRLVVRLTAWYAVVLLATAAGLSGLLYYRLRLNLQQQHDEFVEMNSQDFAGEVLENLDARDPNQMRAELDAEIGNAHPFYIVYRLWSADGRLLIQSPGFPDDAMQPDRTERAKLQPGSPLAPWTIPGGEHGPYRVTIQAVAANGQVRCLVETGYSMRPLITTLRQYRRNFAQILLPLVLVGVIGGWWLARQSLAPIGRMAETAKTISHQSLCKRLPEQGRGDELDRLATVLNDMLGRLQEAFERIDHFSSDLAHELRTPLTELKGEAERALVAELSAEELRSVIAAHSEIVDRLNAMVTDLLYLARHGAIGRLDSYARVDLAECITDTAEVFAPLAETARIELAVSLPEAPCCVRGDWFSLCRAVSNLLDNSLKHTPAGGRIAVELAVGPPHRIVVRDTGEGIPASDLPRVCDRFYRADRSRSRRTGGFGLGLSMCKQIAEDHGGSIRIQSELRGGTTVTLELPPDPGEMDSAPGHRRNPAASDASDDAASPSGRTGLRRESNS
jgi:two-component system heavy metal sensor histidine kinase CusS